MRVHRPVDHRRRPAGRRPRRTWLTSTSTTTTAPPAPTTTTTTTVPRATGLLTFRGDATRTFYGTGPMPAAPAVVWEFPDRRMCSMSTVGLETSEWCGMGWTGQPAVVERGGRTWVIFGAYDGAVHFVDADTGRRILPDFPTGDLIKGSVTVDPDGYPLVYVGSRDNAFRVIAIDRPVATELWRLDAEAVSPTLWNDDWDGSGLVADDYLFEGGENSQFHAVRLNRSYGADGKVEVAPVLAFHAPGWDDELLDALPDYNVSIEGSVALAGGVAWFANSGGLVQGWDVSGPGCGRGAGAGLPVLDGRRRRRHRRGRRRGHALRGRRVGAPDAPLPAGGPGGQARPRTGRIPSSGRSTTTRPRASHRLAGVWATPALWQDLVIVATNGGRLLGIDRATGGCGGPRPSPTPSGSHPWSSTASSSRATATASSTATTCPTPPSTPPSSGPSNSPAASKPPPPSGQGRIYVGTREGHLYAIG